MEEVTKTTQGTQNSVPNTAEEAFASQREVAEPVAAGENTEASSKTQGTNTTEQIDNSVLGSPAAEETTESQPDSKSLKRAEFEKLIKGDYKEFYEERIRDNLSRRFKENAVLKQRNEENSRIVEMLYDRYSIENGNVSALLNAMESDDAYLAEEARKRGMSTEDYKYVRKLESENRRFHMLSSEYEAKQKANRAIENWYMQSRQVKEVYPDFNIFEESKNKSFVSLLKSGIDVKTAYEATHHNEIVARAASEAARNAEIKAAEAIKQRAMRPAENGLSSQSSAIIKSDVSKLSPKERAEIARRASRGERITF